LQAKLADSWLMSDEGSRITIKMVALYHDMELSYLREKIYEQWDAEFIERLRKLPTMKARTVDTVCDEGSDDDA